MQSLDIRPPLLVATLLVSSVAYSNEKPQS